MVSQRRFTIGRAKTCDIPIGHDSVSRMHAEIELLEGDRLRVRDLDSDNGIVLIRQGREFPIKQEVVLLNDTLRFGEVALAVRDVIEILKNAVQPAAAAHAVTPAPVAGAKGFVRCGCGMVKVRGDPCPTCGE
ncbi:MAG: FHA domain-containing protein [Candidatus Binataceae bacterium]|nr:FHA domain-containing protein [Candidatus Binataceae bacterium]